MVEWMITVIIVNIMYSVWEFDTSRANVTRPKATIEQAQQERDRRTRSVELVKSMMTTITSRLPPLSASEELSALFRQRGVPCVDSFTSSIVGAFRRAMQFDPHVHSNERKFMPLVRWLTPNAVATLWTIEPVLSTCLIRGNSIDVRAAYDNYINDLEVIDNMSATTTSTKPKDGNEIRGRWAGWIMWRAALDQGLSDSVCVNCNLCSTLFAVTLHCPDMSAIHLVITPETINIIAPYARNMAPSLGVTATLTATISTKLTLQPSVHTSRNTNLRMFGNGSIQFCGSPMDIELLFTAARVIMKRVMDTDMYSVLSSMRKMNKPMI